MIRLRHIGLLLCGLAPPAAAASDALPRLTRIDEADAGVRLDGFVDEAVWRDLPVIDGMRVIDPDTLAETPYETRIRMFYTERGIYVGAVNRQPPGTLVARMTSRDVRLDRDGFVVGIDASGEGLYGYFLRINLGDSMTDGSVLPERRLNMQWDGPWNGRTQALEDGWSVEYFIPWSMMPLPRADGTRRIGFYFERQVGHLGGEAWSNPPLPRTVNQYLSAFERYELRDIEPRRQLTYYPFATAVFDGIRHELEAKIGSDIYWRPTTNTLLSATVNPDFGTVESDDVVVNLTAFETFFPEKRVFFLEGQDIFNTTPRAGGGNFRGRGPGGPVSLLNTRRIGGAADYDVPEGAEVVATDLSRPTELLGAAKLTGQTGNWRYGALFAAEDDPEISGALDDGTVVGIRATGRDFAVARLLYEDTSGGGRRSVGWMGTDVSHPGVDATVQAVDWHYFSNDSRWVVDGSAMFSDVDGARGAGVFADVGFRPRRGVNHMLRATYMDDELEINDLGFLSRNDQMNLDYSLFVSRSDVPGLRERTTSVFVTNQWNTAGRPVRLGLFWNRGYTFENFSSLDFSFRHFPPRVDDRLGGGTGDFRIPARWGFNAGYESDSARPVSVYAGVNLGQDELGPANVGADAGIAWRPSDRFSLDLNLSYTDREALLVHRGGGAYTSFEAHRWSPRVEANYFITAKQQLRFTMQWTGIKAFEDAFWQVNPARLERLRPVPDPGGEPDDFVISRLAFQARYRWEIAPLSDLFVVYTRGGNLPRDSFLGFRDLLERSWNQPVADAVAVKLRYRFGS